MGAQKSYIAEKINNMHSFSLICRIGAEKLTESRKRNRICIVSVNLPNGCAKVLDSGKTNREY